MKIDNKIIEKKIKHFNDSRTIEQIREHYEIEKELALRLLKATRQERAHLASILYDELYRRVPHHPQHEKKNSIENSNRNIKYQMGFIKPFLRNCRTFLEVGPGDCAVSLEVSKIVNNVYAVDVSKEITKVDSAPQNFRFVLSDGCSVPVESNSVDIVYSHQLMEHLHPDDAVEQLRNIYMALVEGGRYLCVTPNRLTGPHDVSKYFDEVATGFHLKEYSIYELSNLFRGVGFSKTKAYIGVKGVYISFPLFLLVFMEKTVLGLPVSFRKPLSRSIFRVFINMIRMVGIK